MDSSKATYKDYYYILGVSPEATANEIQEAYLDLYERYGPHVSITGHDPEAMLKAYKDICEAYEVLMDPARRQDYDQNNLQHLHKSNLRQLWGKVTLTGEGLPSAPVGTGGEETRIEAEITLREALKGAKRKVRIDEQLPCMGCISQKPMQRLKCDHCRGLGYAHNMRNEELDLPSGMFDRQEIRFGRLGKFDARLGRQGDLIVTVKLRPHQFFTVMGRDLTCTIPITILEAVLGGEINVPTPTGKVVMKIQPLTQSGRLYRLKGMGLAGGDLLVTMQVVIPPQINAEELELYRKLKSLSTTPNPRDEIFQKLAAQPSNSDE